jgi:hypothetical protein
MIQSTLRLSSLKRLVFASMSAFVFGLCVLGGTISPTHAATLLAQSGASAGASASAVSSTTPGPPYYGYENPIGNNVTVPQIVAHVIAQVLPLVGVLFLLMFLWGGFTWMTAGAEDKKLTTARHTLVNAAIGMIIILAAYIIVGQFISIFGKAIGN